MDAIDRDRTDSYYHFLDEAREIGITRHDTPTPWINYLSNGTFHAMLSQAGGGLAFHRSPQIWRITRYRFFHLPTDRSGPYVYLQDHQDGTCWCPTYEPSKARPDEWKASHGLGYTRFEAVRRGIGAQLTYFVGARENALIWHLRLKNNTDQIRRISAYAYVEFGMMEFMRELQWFCYNKHQLSVDYMKAAGTLLYRYGVETQPKPEETPLVYLAADRMPSAYDGDRDEFIGTYRSEENPYAIEHGGCTGSTLKGGDPCGALQFDLELQPGQEEVLNIFLGTGMTEEAIVASVANLRRDGIVEQSLEALKQSWTAYLGKFSGTLPDKDAERMVNIWNPYQAQRNFQFSRNISCYATGTFRGVGYRDTAQDILAQIPFDVAASREKIALLLGEQYRDGHANHYFFPDEGWPPVTTIHSDDHLWPVLAVHQLVMEEGDAGFLHERIRYHDGGEGTVYDHLCNAIAYTESHLGPNGFPLMLRSDWNDMLFKVCREGKGESIWAAMQYGVMLVRMAELARLAGREEDAASFEDRYERQKRLVNDLGWDGRWYRRAVMDNGRFLGTAEHDQAQIWLNAQTWAVMSGMAEGDRGIVAMDSVRDMLDTDLGIKKLHPAMTDFPDPRDPLTNYHPGMGENGSVFCHANTWAILAECLLGRGDQAYKYYRQLLPHVAMGKAGVWRYKAEPYVYSSNLFGPESDRFGLANVSWLTGTAAWMYVVATQYLIGVRPVFEGLAIDPCIPSEWKGYQVERACRGCRYRITVENGSGCCKGVKGVLVDGAALEGHVVPHVRGRTHADVRVIL